MKQQVLFLATAGILSFSGAAAQTDPAPFDLSAGDYSFTEWPESSPAGIFPAGLAFHVSDQGKPELIYTQLAGDWHCGYDLDSRPRFLGLNEDGIAFLNTGNAQFDDCVSGSNTQNVYIGGVVLGLNTTGLDSAFLEYDIQLQTTGDGSTPRQYAVRLQAHPNTSVDFEDVDPVVELSSAGNTAGTSRHEALRLPADLLNQANVQYRWLYYDLDVPNADGTRPRFRIDNIRASRSGVTAPSTGAPAQQAAYTKQLLLYPNPVVQGSMLHFSVPVSGGIYNLAGRLVQEIGRQGQVHTGALVPGMYYIRTEAGDAARFIVR